MVNRNILLKKAQQAKRESKYVDFKEQFDPNSSRDWKELVKDIVAMANSGGGVIVFGVRNNGTPSGHDVTSILEVDPAHFVDKIFRYTGEQFSGCEIEQTTRRRQEVAALIIEAVHIPMVFLKSGGYEISGRQKTAFRVGTVYFRHGAKSEPGNTADIRIVVERELERIRKSWIGNIRKLVKAPAGSGVQVVSPVELETAPVTRIRVTDDPEAPVLRGADPNRTHPYRGKEAISNFNMRFEGRKEINQYDILCVRKVHSIDGKRQYFYKPQYASPTYSDAFVDWLARRYEEDPLFFDEARQRVKNG